MSRATVEWRARIDARELDLRAVGGAAAGQFPRAGGGPRFDPRLGARRGPHVYEPAPAAGSRRTCGCRAAAPCSRASPATCACSATTTTLRSRRPISSSRGAARPGGRPAWCRALTRKDGRIARRCARGLPADRESRGTCRRCCRPGRCARSSRRLAPRGELFGLDVAVTDVGMQRLPDITGRLRFANVGFDPFGKAPGVRLRRSDRGPAAGAASLDSRRATRRSTGRCSGARLAVLRQVDGRIEWPRFDDGVRLWVDDAFMTPATASRAARLRMAAAARRGAAHGHERDGVGFRRDAALALPADRAALTPKSLAWLDAAFRARPRRRRHGVAIRDRPAASRIARGRAYSASSGHAAGIGLFYAPGWPELRGIDVRFQLRRPRDARVASQRHAGGIAITQAEVNSGDYATPSSP